MTHNSHPFQLLEINVISAQDLAPVSKSMRTYGVVWLHSDRKLSTKVDQKGHTNPQWNEKFVFRVDDTFLNAETSSIMIEIYAAAWLRDVQIGSVRVLVSNLFPSDTNSCKTRFVALQIRRPSGRPQGILNLGVQLLNSTMRSMPLYTELSASAVGLNDLMDAKAGHNKHIDNGVGKLRRTCSDNTTTEFTSSTTDEFGGSWGKCGSSLLSGSSLTGSSLAKLRNAKGEDHNKEEKDNGNGSMVNGSMCSDVGPSASVVAAAIAKGLIKPPGNATLKSSGAGAGGGGAGNSILEDWTTEEGESIEGLRTKLERWRTEIPPVYDCDRKESVNGSDRKNVVKRKPEGKKKVFSCFSTLFGFEISISCGGSKTKKGNPKVCHLSSVDGQSYYS